MKIFGIKSNVFKSLFLVALLCCFANTAWAGKNHYYAYVEVITSPAPTGTNVYAKDIQAIATSQDADAMPSVASTTTYQGRVEYTLSILPEDDCYFLGWKYKAQGATGDYTDMAETTLTGDEESTTTQYSYRVNNGIIECVPHEQTSGREWKRVNGNWREVTVYSSQDLFRAGTERDDFDKAAKYEAVAVMAKLACTAPKVFHACDNTGTQILTISHVNAGTITPTLSGSSNFQLTMENSGETTITSGTTEQTYNITIDYDPTRGGTGKTATLTLNSTQTVKDYGVQPYTSSNIVKTITLTAEDCPPTVTWNHTAGLRKGNNYELLMVSPDLEYTLSIDSDYSGEGETLGEGSFDTDKHIFTPTKEGKVKINAHIEGAAGYSSCDTSMIYLISSKTPQVIDWPQYFTQLYVGDSEIELNAVAKANGAPTGKTVTYTLSDVSNSCVSRRDASGKTYLVISATNVGTALLKAHVDGDDTYLPADEIREIKVKEHSLCETNIEIIKKPESNTISQTISNSGSMSGNNTYIFNIADVPCASLAFKLTAAQGSYYVIVDGYTDLDGNGSRTELAQLDCSKRAYNEVVPFTNNFKSNFRSFKITVQGMAVGTFSATILDIAVAQLNYLEFDPSILPTQQVNVNGTADISVKVKYSDQSSLIAYLNPKTAADEEFAKYIEIVEPVAVDAQGRHFLSNVGCGEVGEATIKMRVSCDQIANFTSVLVVENAEKSNESLSETLRNQAKSISLDIPVNVKKGDKYYFVTENNDGDWFTLSNWRIGSPSGSEPIMLPTASNEVEIQANANLSRNANVYSLNMATSGSLTIASTGGLSVYQGGITGATSTNLKLASDATGMGYLRVHPSATNKTVSASVDLFVHGYTDYHSIADAETEEDKLKAINAAIWQYLGTPMATTPQSIDYYGWMYERSNNAWEVCNTSTNLTPFAGYAMTQSLSEAGAAFTCSGELYGFKDWTGTPAEGFQLLANSFTAPIDITKFESIPGDVIYLYREGSFDNYTEYGAETVEPDPNNLSGITSFADFISAGQYLAIPLGTAKLLPKGFATIPPSQGFCIYADGNSLTLDYDELVWGGEGFGLHSRAMAPARKRAAQVNEEVILSEVLGLRVVGDRGSDALGLIESTAFSASFDSGFDGSKVFGSSANPQLYTTEPSGNMMVSATNDLEGMYIGFDAAETDKETLSNYTIEVLYAQEGEYILHDNVTNKDMTLAVGNAYQFTETPGTINEMRFQIQAKRTDGPTTSLVNYGKDETIRMWENGGKLFVSSSIAAEQILRIYDMQGKIVANTKFTDTLTYDLSTLPQGAYMANVGNKSIKIVLK